MTPPCKGDAAEKFVSECVKSGLIVLYDDIAAAQGALALEVPVGEDSPYETIFK